MSRSATTNLPLLYVEYFSVLLSCNLEFNDVLKNSLPLSTHILLVYSFIHSQYFEMIQ